jgi:hypothetical protein
MYLYVFEIYGRTEYVDEVTAHNYLRNPSGAQRAQLKYMGAIKVSDRDGVIKEATLEMKNKFGVIGAGQENDTKILEARAFVDSFVEEKMKPILENIDRKIMPRTLDYIMSRGGAEAHVSSLAEAKQKLM